jgi:ketosteroid isomerase-like protein
MGSPLDLVRQHYSNAARGDLDDIDALFDPDVETVIPGGTLKGVGEFKALAASFTNAISDLRHEIVRSFETGDTAIVEGVFSGRHTGPLVTPEGTIPASGNAVSFPYADFVQVRDGKCVSHRIYWDNVSLMAQLR